MKATVRDPAALGALSPLEVAFYLRSSGWKQVERIGDKAAVWITAPAAGEEYEILLPLRKDVGDYVSRMAEALRALEVAEHRSQLEILADLAVTGSDVIRVRTTQADARDGSLPIDEGVSRVQKAREMMLAAACSAVEPKPYFATRKPAAAVEYMRSVRLGQTERGSYVVTLLSRVPPSLEPDKNGQQRLAVEDPFERRVTLTLARGLAAVRGATQEFATSGDFSAFQQAVSSGVSANLCDAVVGMAGGFAESRDLELDVTWSRLRPLENPRPIRVLLTSDAISVIQEAGRIFRETSPRDDFELLGIVTGLDRTDPDAPGRVTVLGFVDDAARKVHLPLRDEDYQLAIQAHQDYRPIRCLGQLVKSGPRFELRDPHHFELAADS